MKALNGNIESRIVWYVQYNVIELHVQCWSHYYMDWVDFDVLNPSEFWPLLLLLNFLIISIITFSIKFDYLVIIHVLSLGLWDYRHLIQKRVGISGFFFFINLLSLSSIVAEVEIEPSTFEMIIVVFIYT